MPEGPWLQTSRCLGYIPRTTPHYVALVQLWFTPYYNAFTGGQFQSSDPGSTELGVNF